MYRDVCSRIKMLLKAGYTAEVIELVMQENVLRENCMDENTLLREIAELEEKIKMLSDEKARLCKLLVQQRQSNTALSTSTTISESTQFYTQTAFNFSTPALDASAKETQAQRLFVCRASQPGEKIDFFISLFRGRQNVYAKRCYSKKDENAFYMPICGNYKKRGCERPRIKCGVCQNGAPLTPQVIYGHLKNNAEHGVGIIGVYPLLEDDSCNFLAVDFDGNGWMDDIKAYRAVCAAHNVPIAVERSRSGQGGHVWTFFEQPVSAAQARKMGSMLITKAMANRHTIQFSTYDRMFPNQDLLPTGGLGNLIALPFQGGPAKEGNSLFVDDNFVPYDDQWAFLSVMAKMTADEVSRLAVRKSPDGETGVLARVSFDEAGASKPWESKKPQKPLASSDIYGDMTVVEANMLYLRKDSASQKALNRIKRLAAFSNPEFYKKQQMRFSTKDIPRIIYSLDETPEYLGIPRGCKDALIDLLRPTGCSVVFDDKRNPGKHIDVCFCGELHEEQLAAADAMYRHETGVLCAATAFGKTVIGAALIARHKRSTLVLVHTLALLEQWKQSLEQFLDINEVLPEVQAGRGRKKQRYLVGQLGGGKDTASGIIDIAIMQSLFHEKEVKETVKNYGLVIADECHHIPAVNFEKILKTANAQFVYGLTATPQRQDGHHPLMYMQCGPARYTVDAKSQAIKRGFEHYVIPCFTGFMKPLTISESEWHYKRMESDITMDEYRNRQIAADVLNAVAEGRSPIILTQRTEHISTLASLLEGKCNANIVVLNGSLSAKQKKDALSSVYSIPANEQLIIIATGKYIGEGFDCPRLDTLFLAMPIAWKGTLSQYAGRLHRAYQGKENVQIYDYIDVRVAVFENMYHKRAATYTSIGYKTLASRNQTEQSNMIYDSNSFEPVIREDFGQAKGSVLIVSPFLLIRRTQTIISWLAPLLRDESPVSVTVLTRDLCSFKEKERAGVQACLNALRAANVQVLHKPNIHQKIVIIDARLVWYGSINLLSYGKNSEESVMRFESREIASELAAIVYG
jgi:superfamily II DNA or RNA helicase